MPKLVARIDPITGLSQMTLEDDDDEDYQANKSRPTPEELRHKAQREREEKQKKYEEVRARLFGTPSTGSGTSSLGSENIMPVSVSIDGRSNRGNNKSRPGSRQESRRPQLGTPVLFDPNSTQKRNADVTTSGRSTPKQEEQRQIIREPKGPDPSGRGGFGFSNRPS